MFQLDCGSVERRGRVFVGQCLRVADDQLHELLLTVCLQQLLPELHVGQDGGERARRLQSVLCAFLLEAEWIVFI